MTQLNCYWNWRKSANYQIVLVWLQIKPKLHYVAESSLSMTLKRFFFFYSFNLFSFKNLNLFLTIPRVWLAFMSIMFEKNFQFYSLRDCYKLL